MRQTQLVEVNKFTAGLITDASPLTAPDNSCLDVDNFVFNIDGSSNRRLGMDYELGFDIIDSNVNYIESTNIGIRSYKWNNVGGEPTRVVQVVQVGNRLDFFHLNGGPISTEYFHSETFVGSLLDTKFSFATVDGLLVVVNGDKDIYIFEYTDPNIITKTNKRLLIRDFFGVDDTDGGVDITRGSEVQNRPSILHGRHIYNLRNQSFGIPRIHANDGGPSDPITAFVSVTGGKYPSNADTVVSALYPDPEDSNNRIVDRFFATDLNSNPIGSTRAAQGYFIIDALDRGASRVSENAKNMARYPALSLNISGLATDQTPKGATAVTEFAGRIFYGGFTGEVIGPDGHSPKLSSYILFSKVVDSIADINVCYQSNDPTSKDFPDIIATDGGFIRLNEAYGIQKLLNLGSSLMVVAKNGVWRITGGSDNGFNATTYIVEKISDRGCTSPDSIVIIDNGFMFWSDDGIYSVSQDQFGSWVNNNISFGRIQRFYDDIPTSDKQLAYGAYDSYERKVHWLFYNSLSSNQEVKELILDLQLQAFYPHTIKRYGDSAVPRPACMFVGLPYQIDISQIPVVVNDDPVVIGSDAVIISNENRLGVTQRELGYVIVTSIDGMIEYTFGRYSNLDFRDWFSVDNIGVDADAFMITNYLSGNDFQRDKQVPYITAHLRRTENGVDENSDPINQSSCYVQSRWDWSDTNKSNKWSREFQAYRYRRLYLPLNDQDDYDNGFDTVVTKNKVRGNGKVLSLRFRTEPYRNLHLYGWSMIFSVTEQV